MDQLNSQLDYIVNIILEFNFKKFARSRYIEFSRQMIIKWNAILNPPLVFNVIESDVVLRGFTFRAITFLRKIIYCS